MESNKLYALIWKLIITLLSILILTIGGCTAHQQQKITELIIHGTDPTLAHCAIKGINSQNSVVCGLHVIKP